MKIDGSKDIRFAHIMIDKVNYDSDVSAFDAMSKVVNKINTGENFEDLAKKYSDDVVTKDIGGDLEYFDADVFPEQFALAIKDLGLDEISDVIELEDTLHILKVTEVVENEEETPDIFKREQTISNQQRRHYEKLRATTLNKMLKNYKRRQKNSLNIARKLGKK